MTKYQLIKDDVVIAETYLESVAFEIAYLMEQVTIRKVEVYERRTRNYQGECKNECKSD